VTISDRKILGWRRTAQGDLALEQLGHFRHGALHVIERLRDD
jgi:hypothetical protein